MPRFAQKPWTKMPAHVPSEARNTWNGDGAVSSPPLLRGWSVRTWWPLSSASTRRPPVNRTMISLPDSIASSLGERIGRGKTDPRVDEEQVLLGTGIALPRVRQTGPARCDDRIRQRSASRTEHTLRAYTSLLLRRRCAIRWMRARRRDEGFEG